MSLEESTCNPLEYGHSNYTNQICDLFFVIFKLCAFSNSLVEEHGEGLKRVLIHRVNNVELDKQEIEHGSLCCNRSVDLTRLGNNLPCDLSYFLLLLDFHRSLFGNFKTLDKFEVFEDSGRVSIG